MSDWTHETITQLVNERDALQKRLAELESIMARLPRTADGVPLYAGMVVYFECPDSEYWGVDRDAIVSMVVKSIWDGCAFAEYRGTFTISDDDYECGNLDVYSTKEAAESARAPRVQNVAEPNNLTLSHAETHGDGGGLPGLLDLEM